MGNEQSQPVSRESPPEADDDFNLDNIPNDDDPTPPPTPLPPPQETEIAETSKGLVKNGKRRQSALNKLDATGRVYPPSARRKRANRTGKKQKLDRASGLRQNAEQQSLARTKVDIRRDEPEAFGHYASSEASEREGEEPFSKSPMKAEPPSARISPRKHAGTGRDRVDERPEAEAVDEQYTKKIIRETSLPHASLAFPKNELFTTGEIEEDHRPELKPRVQLMPVADDEDYEAYDTHIRPEGRSGQIDDTTAPMSRNEHDARQPQQVPEDDAQAHQTATTENENTSSTQTASTNDVEMEDAQAESSDQPVSSPNSVFDPSDSPAPANNVPKPKVTLKRKRDSTQNTPTPRSPRQRRIWRRDVFSPSPPTSVELAGAIETKTKPKNKKRKFTKTSTEKSGLQAPEKVSTSQPTLGSWAKSLSSDSSLRHPIFNPASPKRLQHRRKANSVTQETSPAGLSNSSLQVLIPKLPSSRPKEVIDKATLDLTSASKKRSKVVYTSAKGKKRADPNVDYTSPSPNKSRLGSGSPELGLDDSEAGLATTFARRTFPSRRRKSNQTTPTSDDVESKTGDDDELANEADTSSDDSEDQNVFRCKRCNQIFTNAKNLRLHLKRKGIHGRLHKCSDCSKQFYSANALAKHQKKKLHGNGAGSGPQKGALTPVEIKKLEKWRDSFCAEYEISQTDFNDLMTDSCRRAKDFVWPWVIISKTDLLDLYRAVLPDRDWRSMLRYRERNFKNLPTSKEWTKEDDDQLADLVSELGSKWIEIGQRLTRTGDAVHQRWRNKVQYREKMNKGLWEPHETDLLTDAVKALKERLGVPLSASTDDRISWVQVSNEIGNIRTAQQCSGHWDWLRQNHRFSKTKNLQKEDDRSRRSELKRKGRPAPEARLEDSIRSGKGGRRPVSDVYVQSSDEEEEVKEAANGEEKGDERDEGNEKGIEQRGRRPDPEIEFSPTQTMNKMKSSRYAAKLDEATPPGGVKPTWKNVYTIPDSQSTRKGTPQLPRNPLATTTPAQDMTLSQAFGNTQTNTSVLKKSAWQTYREGSDEDATEVSQNPPERPSPEIEIRLRPASQRRRDEETIDDMRGVDKSDDNDDDNDDDDDDDDDEEEEKDGEVQKEAEEDPSESEAADLAEDATASDIEEEHGTKVQMNQELGEDTESEEESTGEEDQMDAEHRSVERESEAEEDSDTEMTSSSGSEEEDGEDEEEDEDEDSMVAGAMDDYKSTSKDDWMANMHATAAKSNERLGNLGRRRIVPKAEDSESE